MLKFSFHTAPRNIFSIIMFICIYPLAQILPTECGWENGLIENTQVVMLLIGFLSCIDLGYYYYGAKAYAFSSLFLLMAGRELSWGRVLLPPKEITEMGPGFISMSDIPHYELINIFIGLIIFSVTMFLYKAIDWKVFFTIPIPAITVLIIFAALTGQIACEKGLFGFLPHSKSQTAEELCELIVYFESLGVMMHYYAIKYIAIKENFNLTFDKSKKM